MTRSLPLALPDKSTLSSGQPRSVCRSELIVASPTLRPLTSSSRRGNLQPSRPSLNAFTALTCCVLPLRSMRVSVVFSRSFDAMTTASASHKSCSTSSSAVLSEYCFGSSSTFSSVNFRNDPNILEYRCTSARCTLQPEMSSASSVVVSRIFISSSIACA